MIYVNGQEISSLVLGGLEATTWLRGPEVFAVRPEQYLLTLDSWLAAAGYERSQITGFVIVKGPGSATALRTAHAMVNALALALSVPVIGIEKLPESGDAESLVAAANQAPHTFALPVYAHIPNITKTNRDVLKRKLN